MEFHFLNLKPGDRTNFQLYKLKSAYLRISLSYFIASIISFQKKNTFRLSPVIIVTN